MPKPNLRKLRFENIDQAIAEANRLADLQRANSAQYAGKWNVAQILNHCGAWAEYAYKPNPLKAPWFIRFAVRFVKTRLLNKGFPSGTSIPKVPGGTLHIEPADLDQSLALFTSAYTRLKHDTPTHPSPVFGPLTHEQAIKLNLRHAELHMSFVKG